MLFCTGVFDKSLGPLFAQTFVNLGMHRAVVVHSAEGLFVSSFISYFLYIFLFLALGLSTSGPLNLSTSRSTKAFVMGVLVCALGMDEVSPAGVTHCWFVNDGNIEQKDIHPSDFGLPTHTLDLVAG